MLSPPPGVFLQVQHNPLAGPPDRALRGKADSSVTPMSGGLDSGSTDKQIRTFIRSPTGLGNDPDESPSTQTRPRFLQRDLVFGNESEIFETEATFFGTRPRFSERDRENGNE